MASFFGHPLAVNIHDYLLLLVVTSLECIVTTNNSNLAIVTCFTIEGIFLDPICAVSRQFVASVFGITLVIGI